jgi:hypothetical protein
MKKGERGLKDHDLHGKGVGDDESLKGDDTGMRFCPETSNDFHFSPERPDPCGSHLEISKVHHISLNKRVRIKSNHYLQRSSPCEST